MKLSIVTIIVLAAFIHLGNAAYQVGTGIADVTGPAAEINMMGYAAPGQVTAGIHMRQFARTFIIDDNTKRVVFVNVDCAMIDQLVKLEVMKKLEDTYGSLYSTKNVLLSGTHTHSGPGGFLQYLLFAITSKGLVEQSLYSLVDGIVMSIDRAHNNMKEANIYYSKDRLIDANINRSPAAYLNNPAPERAKYDYNTDKDMVQLKFVGTDADKTPIGILNWYAVHLTSMNNTNLYISGDNKGYAQLQFEARINGEDVMPGKGSFIAAFGSTNLGDVSPNTNGAKCIDTGLPCDFVASSCNNRVQLCIAFGPGKDMVDSTRIIGQKQLDKAWEMFNLEEEQQELLEGPVQFFHQYVDMPNYKLEVNGAPVNVCKPALGYSFAAGTTDGPGAFTFLQGTTSGNVFWDMVGSALQPPSDDQIECHAPKPILLDTGEISWPYDWHPVIVETQLFRIGQVIIAGVPGEFTTMAGRRFRNQIDKVAGDSIPGVKTIIAGLSNVYTHYITTFEEYQVQRYEGGSTIYGPHTLSAYLDQYSNLAKAMIDGTQLDDGPTPPNLLDVSLSLVPGVVFDKPPYGKNFGDVLRQPYPLVYPGETVYATFVSGHPRNDLMTEKTFMELEMMQEDGSWKVIRTDSHFDTWYKWKATARGQSESETRWDVPADAMKGVEYRFKHYGHYKTLNGTIFPYEGESNSFKVGGN